MSDDSLNILDRLKQQLESIHMFDGVRNAEFVDQINGSYLDAMINEFVSYSNTGTYIDKNANGDPVNMPFNIETPEDCDKAVKVIGTLQQRLDRLTWAYNLYILPYNAIQRSRSQAAAYLNIQVKEIKILKNEDMRKSAVNYVLSEFDDLSSRLDGYYQVIDSVRHNIVQSIMNLRLQLDLYTGKLKPMMGQNSSIAGAGEGPGGGRRRGV